MTRVMIDRTGVREPGIRDHRAVCDEDAARPAGMEDIVLAGENREVRARGVPIRSRGEAAGQAEPPLLRQLSGDSAPGILPQSQARAQRVGQPRLGVFDLRGGSGRDAHNRHRHVVDVDNGADTVRGPR